MAPQRFGENYGKRVAVHVMSRLDLNQASSNSIDNSIRSSLKWVVMT